MHARENREEAKQKQKNSAENNYSKLTPQMSWDFLVLRNVSCSSIPLTFKSFPVDYMLSLSNIYHLFHTWKGQDEAFYWIRSLSFRFRVTFQIPPRMTPTYLPSVRYGMAPAYHRTDKRFMTALSGLRFAFNKLMAEAAIPKHFFYQPSPVVAPDQKTQRRKRGVSQVTLGQVWVELFRGGSSRLEVNVETIGEGENLGDDEEVEEEG